MSDPEEFVFVGCKFLQYDGYSLPRQGISLGQGRAAVCFARVDMDGKMQLCQFCKRGRMNYPLAGIGERCCSEYEETTHHIAVPVEELNSNPFVWRQDERPIE